MIPLKTEKEIRIMAENGRDLAFIMNELKKRVKPGVTTQELNRVAETLILNYGGEPSFKGQEGFPAALCTSINEEVVHGVPSQRKLKPGDILSLDIGLKRNGFHSDMAITMAVGDISPDAQRLVRTAKKALKRGIKKARPGNTLGDISNTIQRCIEEQGFGVVKELCGHGIGRELHEEPQILNYGKRGAGLALAKGMVICLEPMVTMGDWRIKKSKDVFGYITADNSLSAHFEHTIAITDKVPLVLTSLEL